MWLKEYLENTNKCFFWLRYKLNAHPECIRYSLKNIDLTHLEVLPTEEVNTTEKEGLHSS